MDLSQFFTTKAQATDFSVRLATISAHIYKTDFDLEKALLDTFGMEKKDMLVKLLNDTNVAVGTPSALKEFFEKIQQAIASLPVLSLTIAFEPREQTLKEISEWFVLNIKSQVLFAITVDTNLIGGATITFNGKYVDYCVKVRFEKILTSIVEKEQTNQASEKPIANEHQSIEHLHFGR